MNAPLNAAPGPAGFRFRVRAPLRCDGVGRLDVAEDVKTQARLAVRWIPVAAGGTQAMEACERLPLHPALPRVVQTGIFQGQAFVALSFPEGQALSTLLGNRLETALVLQMGEQLMSALATLHAASFVHGELSGESVLVASPGRSFLWDVPLVVANRMSDRRGDHRINHHLTQLAPFLSPDRAQGGGATQPDDVYAAAALICAAGGAALPYVHTALGIVHQVASGAFTWSIPPTFPDSWRFMLERMLSPYPVERPTAAEAQAVFAEPLQAKALHTIPEMPVVRLEAMIGHFRRQNAQPQVLVAKEHPTHPDLAMPPVPSAPTALSPVPSLPTPVPQAAVFVERFVQSTPTPAPSKRPEEPRAIPVLTRAAAPARPPAETPTASEPAAISFLSGLAQPQPPFYQRYWWAGVLLAGGIAAGLWSLY